MIEDRKYREFYLHAERTAEQRRKDMVLAFDQIYDLKCKLRSVRTKLWVVIGALVIAGGVIKWESTALLDCVQTEQRGLFFHVDNPAVPASPVQPDREGRR